MVSGVTHPHICGARVTSTAITYIAGRRAGCQSQRHLSQSLRQSSRNGGIDWRRRHLHHPYRHKAQVVSGTLAYALSAGKAIISTPYLHAIELLDQERGTLVPFDDPEAIATRTVELLDNGTARHAMRKRPTFTPETWSGIA